MTVKSSTFKSKFSFVASQVASIPDSRLLANKLNINANEFKFKPTKLKMHNENSFENNILTSITNSDNIINILDVVLLINIVLGN